MFVDKVKIYVKAGNGGHGCTSFLREKYVAKGGPDGGDGGDGGSVILITDSAEQSLRSLRFCQHHTAKVGGSGQGRQKHGANADDLIVKIPIGTIIYDWETNEVLADLCEEGQTYIVARGGKGGRGNKRFATSTNRAPRHHEEGTLGEEAILRLELKIIADVGLVGYPNAGKSTFLNSIANTNSKTASYPFTTLTPHIGVINFSHDYSYERLIVADIPGLVDGASKNIGLGHSFLKHIERNNILAFVLDMVSTASNPVEDLNALKNELELYQEGLSKKAKLVIANKMDEPKASEALEELRQNCNLPIFPIIAELGEGVEQVVEFLREENRKLKPVQPPKIFEKNKSKTRKEDEVEVNLSQVPRDNFLKTEIEQELDDDF